MFSFIFSGRQLKLVSKKLEANHFLGYPSLKTLNASGRFPSPQTKKLIQKDKKLKVIKPAASASSKKLTDKSINEERKKEENNTLQLLEPKCMTCGKKFSNTSNLKRHVSSSHVGINIKCKICGIPFNRLYSLQLHLRNRHNQEETIMCEKCPNKKFGDHKSLFEHICKCHPKDHPCRHCGSTYTQAKYLVRHMKEKHKNEQLKISYAIFT